MSPLLPLAAPVRGACAVLLICLVTVAPSRAQNVDEDWWGADFAVTDFLLHGTTLYATGPFTWVGPHTGGGVPVDPGTGMRVSGFPRVQTGDLAGSVYAAVSDGAGGWYIGGAFDSVGGLPRQCAAHILPDLSVGAWAPDPDAIVYAMALDGSTVYLGGAFTQIGGMPRSNIAAVDAVTGLATAWNPSSDGFVEDLEVYATSVFVGGTFATIGGVARANLAQIDLTTGFATAWNPSPNGTVRDVEVLSPGGTSYLYAGGNFTAMGPQTRFYLAEVDISSGQATVFHPHPDAPVYALAGNDSLLYAGGLFMDVAGLTRLRLVEIDIALGEPTEFVCDADDRVETLLMDGSQLYIGGAFETLCGVSRNCAGRIDLASGSGSVDSWDPDAVQWINTFAPGVAGDVYVGGVFFGINGKTRNHLAAFDTITGQLSPWNPDLGGIASVLATDGSQLFVGGEFATVGGTARSRLASFDIADGTLTSWNPTADARVTTISVRGSSVYVGGYFTQAGGLARAGLAAIDLAGAVLPWNPSPNATGWVDEIEATAGGIYVGGFFTQIGGQPRNNIARIDAGSGLAMSWNPNASSTVTEIEVGASTVYVGGGFHTIGGASRFRVAELDVTTGLATSWDAAITGGGLGLVEVFNDKLWIGGNFSTVQGQPRPRIAAFSLATQSLLAWDPVPNTGPVVALLDDGTNLFLGGSFLSLGTSMTYSMAKTDGSQVGAPVTGAAPGGPMLAVSPNPLRGAGVLHFDLRREGDVRLELFDVRGRRVRMLLDGVRLPAGRHAVALPASDLPPGVYFARWQGAGDRAAAKVTVVK